MAWYGTLHFGLNRYVVPLANHCSIYVRVRLKTICHLISIPPRMMDSDKPDVKICLRSDTFCCLDYRVNLKADLGGKSEL